MSSENKPNKNSLAHLISDLESDYQNVTHQINHHWLGVVSRLAGVAAESDDPDTKDELFLAMGGLMVALAQSGMNQLDQDVKDRLIDDFGDISLEPIIEHLGFTDLPTFVNGSLQLMIEASEASQEETAADYFVDDDRMVTPADMNAAEIVDDVPENQELTLHQYLLEEFPALAEYTEAINDFYQGDDDRYRALKTDGEGQPWIIWSEVERIISSENPDNRDLTNAFGVQLDELRFDPEDKAIPVISEYRFLTLLDQVSSSKYYHIQFGQHEDEPFVETTPLELIATESDADSGETHTETGSDSSIVPLTTPELYSTINFQFDDLKEQAEAINTFLFGDDAAGGAYVYGRRQRNLVSWEKVAEVISFTGEDRTLADEKFSQLIEKLEITSIDIDGTETISLTDFLNLLSQIKHTDDFGFNLATPEELVSEEPEEENVFGNFDNLLKHEVIDTETPIQEVKTQEESLEINWEKDFGGIRVPTRIAKTWMSSAHRTTEGQLVISSDQIERYFQNVSSTTIPNLMREQDRVYKFVDLENPEEVETGLGRRNFYSLETAAVILDNARFAARKQLLTDGVLKEYETRKIHNDVWVTQPVDVDLPDELGNFLDELDLYQLADRRGRHRFVDFHQLQDLAPAYTANSHGALMSIAKTLRFVERGYVRRGKGLVDADGNDLERGQKTAHFIPVQAAEYLLKYLTVKEKINDRFLGIKVSDEHESSNPEIDSSIYAQWLEAADQAGVVVHHPTDKSLVGVELDKIFSIMQIDPTIHGDNGPMELLRIVWAKYYTDEEVADMRTSFNEQEGKGRGKRKIRVEALPDLLVKLAKEASIDLDALKAQIAAWKTLESEEVSSDVFEKPEDNSGESIVYESADEHDETTSEIGELDQIDIVPVNDRIYTAILDSVPDDLLDEVAGFLFPNGNDADPIVREVGGDLWIDADHFTRLSTRSSTDEWLRDQIQVIFADESDAYSYRENPQKETNRIQVNLAASLAILKRNLDSRDVVQVPREEEPDELERQLRDGFTKIDPEGRIITETDLQQITDYLKRKDISQYVTQERIGQSVVVDLLALPGKERAFKMMLVTAQSNGVTIHKTEDENQLDVGQIPLLIDIFLRYDGPINRLAILRS